MQNSTQPQFVARFAFLAMTIFLFSCVSAQENRKQPVKLIHVDSGGLTQAMVGARTVAFHPNARIARPIEGRSSEKLRNEMDRALQAAFMSRGYQLTSPDKADRLLAYAIGVTGQLEDSELQDIFGISAGLDTTGEVERGGIVLAIINPRIHQISWRASGSGRAKNPGSSQKQDASRIAIAVDTLLKSLPRR